MIIELENTVTPLKGVANAVVVFYTDWCGDCLTSLSFEKSLAEKYAKSISFFRMHAEKHEKVADQYSVERYPTYVFFKKGKHHGSNLVEPYHEEDVEKWIKGNLKS